MMEEIDKIVGKLASKLEKDDLMEPRPFVEFLDGLSKDPKPILRNIFQMFYDMVHHYVKYNDNEKRGNFTNYDFNGIFVEDGEEPYFADLILGNRIMRMTDHLKQGAQQNKMYLLGGPHGSGKSTLLNILLTKMEQYTRLDAGMMFETIWQLDTKRFIHLQDENCSGVCNQEKLAEIGDVLSIPCPSHDHPILQIPKNYRKEFLDEIIKDGDLKRKIFEEKEFEWIFKSNACTICNSVYSAIADKLKSPKDVFDMLFVRRFVFDRRIGRGINVFNASDMESRYPYHENPELQKNINAVFKDSNLINYIFSQLAMTNNGVLALMDIKEANVPRFRKLHGIISDGVHKVGSLEESINSLFIATINPEDKENYKDLVSFEDRIVNLDVPYVLDYDAEVNIYKSKFGENITKRFLPRVLKNFAKIIVSTRLETRSYALKSWIKDPSDYKNNCDQELHLLKMEIYSGRLPEWLTESDKKRFTETVRLEVLAESESEGSSGISGRKSIELFQDFCREYVSEDRLVDMKMLNDFFENLGISYEDMIPDDFLQDLTKLYDYNLIEEMKESIYYYNEAQISKDIMNYMYAISFDYGANIKCPFTGDEFEVTEEYFNHIESKIFSLPGSNKQEYRDKIQGIYVGGTLTQEIMFQGKPVTETKMFNHYFKNYVSNIKKNVLAPLAMNPNFEIAIKDFGTENYNSHDSRLKKDIDFLMQNMQQKFGYTLDGARDVCLYAIGKGLCR